MNLKKNLDIALCFVLFTIVLALNVNAQERSRVVQQKQPDTTQTRESQPINQSPNSTELIKKTILSAPTNRPPLSNQIIVSNQVAQSLVKKTSSSLALNAPNYSAVSSGRFLYGAGLKSKMMYGINARLGIPYLYGSTGPNRYDCSGFVWSVFNDAGIYFERSSAKTFWTEFESVTGDERFQFGTLVFFNQLGHVGIVADEKGFYHASSSKGITYSTFEGYWGKRIVGFRRIPVNQN
ncbi:MAG: C40 family peptidase [Pyrinomonadaceae bacterium]|nr:C40 family peptidase [Pyrinomonadaceae bacterium]